MTKRRLHRKNPFSGGPSRAGNGGAMSIEHWLLYLVAAAGLSLTPGPNGLLALTNGMRFGVRRTVAASLGSTAGFLCLIAVSMVGLGALLATSEQAFVIAKWLGAAYLIYLGIRTWRAPVAEDGHGQVEPTGKNKPATLFSQGFLVATSNPKALIFFAAFLPQFMIPGLSWPLQFLVLGGTFAAIEFFYELLLAGAATRVAPWLHSHQRAVNRATGAIFIGIGGMLASLGRSG